MTLGVQHPKWVDNDATTLSAGQMTVQTATAGDGSQSRFLVMDVDGGTDGDFRIELVGVSTLTTSDFDFI
jgi:hypothetical protein